MTALSSETLKAGLASSREQLLRVIAGVSEPQFKQRPPVSDGEQGWSIAEVLAHLLWSERLRSSWIRAAIREPGSAVFPPAGGERQAAAQAGRLAPVPQLIHGLLATRRELEKLLDEAGTTAGGAGIPVKVHGRKPKTVGWVVLQWVIAHELEHVGQIEALRVAVGVSEGQRI